MANNSNDSVNNRLEQSSSGNTPKINPDEQRKYLGTFRERVSLAIKIKDMSKDTAENNFKKEIKANPNYVVFLNGNVGQDQIGPYLKIAADNNIEFDIRTDSFYKTDPDSYGLVYANKNSSINVNPVEMSQKYPINNNDDHKSNQNNQSKSKPSLLDRIKKLF
ncbi:hypothetical protein WR164_06320 [Philodulcilactobacillus myokoensis]|uniref:DUF1694 domain-containing protein n=1 Tax=Philodulcilactobacillus myokoensis TaxID=2929573 RepID=A0A9W6B103_9LACO|nr:YueI family protein [Philodulcilactobacillus myokoensis]GLB46653.1 hypothetical protein WR164_06320 [Philodulcilactobacillus myokoensis]